MRQMKNKKNNYLKTQRQAQSQVCVEPGTRVGYSKFCFGYQILKRIGDEMALLTYETSSYSFSTDDVKEHH